MSNVATFDTSHAPDEETPLVSPREATDASRLSFPLPMVLAMLASIAVTAFGMGAMQYVLQGADREALLRMQSDIRSISERIDSQAKIDDANKRADAAERSSQIQSYESTKQAVDSMRGVVQLLQLQVAELLKQQKR